MRRLLLCIGLVCLLFCYSPCAFVHAADQKGNQTVATKPTKEPATTAAAGYVGQQVCAACHLSLVKHLKAGMGYRKTAIDGTAKAINPRQVPVSLQSQYQSPYLHVNWAMSEDWALLGDWNYYGYGEGGSVGPTVPRNFHGNVYTLGMHYEF